MYESVDGARKRMQPKSTPFVHKIAQFEPWATEDYSVLNSVLLIGKLVCLSKIIWCHVYLSPLSVAAFAEVKRYGGHKFSVCITCLLLRWIAWMVALSAAGAVVVIGCQSEHFYKCDIAVCRPAHSPPPLWESGRALAWSVVLLYSFRFMTWPGSDCEILTLCLRGHSVACGHAVIAASFKMWRSSMPDSVKHGWNAVTSSFIVTIWMHTCTD